MHITRVLHKVFASSSTHIDKRIHRTLLEAVVTLSDCKHLSIAGIGRCLRSTALVKHTIKRIDRLFGNVRLHHQRIHYYQTMINVLLKANSQPVIIVDWSGLTRCGEYHFLRASIAVGGRALTLWESSYREKDYMSQQTHKAFLKELKALLPQDCRPIIVTDAGFRNTWFNLVRQQGWEFVGRVRHMTQYSKERDDIWVRIKTLHGKATRVARYVFTGFLAKANPMLCHVYLVRGEKQHRVRKNLRGKKIQSSESLKHEKREREPWVVVSSLPAESYTATQIIGIYKKRMQIEEAFRDLKNTRNGFSLRHCRSFDTQRLNIALLIAAIAMLLLWIIGIIAKQEKQHRLFQANTVRHRAVLSTFTIGWQYLKRFGESVSLRQVNQALHELQLCAR